MKGKRSIFRYIINLAMVLVMLFAGSASYQAASISWDELFEKSGWYDSGQEEEETKAPETEKKSSKKKKKKNKNKNNSGNNSNNSNSSSKNSSGKNNKNNDSDQTAETSKSGETQTVTEDGTYTSKEEVAEYLHLYGHLPDNFITKNEAKKLGWVNSEGNLDKVAPGKSIGGDYFGNYEGQIPEKKGRSYYECDIDYQGGYRASKRIIYSSDGLIFYTEDHYQTFEQLY